ncbi:hypothetical protein Cob_v011749 [Colletotrichum orbiculare MAFF 240422]|uniref:Uncharacterized protein n=1 Tax=Colletotrichum orbiculare (strain 104-T / ATCC 96160 / CBS 514.97 / LARS 414 / MAFF 240422) TaxID=1213857 RepID=A0A484FBB8_COLOR|nr:hypothetical protein Cob_v011749 [Colletotrichum orbiculare MAFF 240422]
MIEKTHIILPVTPLNDNSVQLQWALGDFAININYTGIGPVLLNRSGQNGNSNRIAALLIDDLGRKAHIGYGGPFQGFEIRHLNNCNLAISETK